MVNCENNERAANPRRIETGVTIMKYVIAGVAALALIGCASVPTGAPALTTASQIESQTKFKEAMSGVVEAKGPTMRADGKTWLVSGVRNLEGAWAYKLQLASDTQDVSGLTEATSSGGGALHVTSMGKTGTSCRAYAKNCRVDSMVAVDLDSAALSSAKTGGMSLTVKGASGSVSANAPGYYVEGFINAVEAFDKANPGKSIDLFHKQPQRARQAPAAGEAW